MTYTTIETAIINKFLEKFPELSNTRCKAGDVDAVFDAVFSEGAKVGCVLEFDGGSQDTAKPYNQQVFTWELIGIMFIRYTETAESDLRNVLDRIPYLFQNDHTLGGVTPRAKLVSISAAEPMQVNDTPFYWVDFRIYVDER